MNPLLFCIIIIIYCSFAATKSVAEPFLSTNLWASTEVTDNALRQERGKLSEIQSNVGMGITLGYDNAWMDAEVAYQADIYYFSHDTQQQRDTIEGLSRLTFGKANDFINLELSHSQRLILNTLNDVEILENYDERKILSVKPILRYRASAVDRVLFSSNAEKVRYRFNDINDSDRIGAEILWEHRLSEIDSVTARTEYEEIEFADTFRDNYDYQSAYLGWRSSLDKLSYFIEVGKNRFLIDREVIATKPSYFIELRYILSDKELTFLAQRYFTDSSIGDGNDFDFTELEAGGDIQQLEVYELRRGSFSWSGRAWCQSCQAGAVISYRSELYTSAVSDNEELQLEINSSWQLNAIHEMTITLQRREHFFDASSNEDDFYRHIFSLEYAYQASRNVVCGVYSSIEHRYRTNIYTVYNVGANINYQF